jgi:hypothetical protein
MLSIYSPVVYFMQLLYCNIHFWSIKNNGFIDKSIPGPEPDEDTVMREERQ